MAPSVSALVLALLPLVSSLPGQSPPASVQAVNANSTAKIDNSWLVVWKEEADDKAIAARQAEFATTLKKRSLSKRDSNGDPMPMDSKNFAIRNFRATVCNTDPETMNLMLSDAAAQVDWVEVNPKVSSFQASAKKPEPPPPNFDFQAAAEASKARGGPQGENTTVYIMDTGVNVRHTVFENRATMLANLVQGESDEDLNGHGTHTAGSAAGLGTGVAPKAQIKGIKILNAQGAGGGDSIIGGFDAACTDVQQNKLQGRCVVSMSLGSDKSNAINRAAQSMSECGCAMVVAAGNEDRNASLVSPASSDGVITVGATDARTNQIAGFSNRGKDVDINVNGVNVISADAKNPDGFKELTGTSMSCPQVAGKVLEIMSSGGITCNADCTDVMRKALQQEAKKSPPVQDKSRALDTTPLQLNTSSQVPVDRKGPTPIGAGAKPGGASQGGDAPPPARGGRGGGGKGGGGGAGGARRGGAA